MFVVCSGRSLLPYNLIENNLMTSKAGKSKKGSKQEKPTRGEKAEKAGEFAKNIWLAGLGAYGKAYDAATDVSRDADSFFEGLVERGQAFEEQARDQIAKPIPKLDISKPKMAIEERIEKMRNYLGAGGSTSKDTEIENLKKQVKTLESKLQSLSDD